MPYLPGSRINLGHVGSLHSSPYTIERDTVLDRGTNDNIDGVNHRICNLREISALHSRKKLSINFLLN